MTRLSLALITTTALSTAALAGSHSSSESDPSLADKLHKEMTEAANTVEEGARDAYEATAQAATNAAEATRETADDVAQATEQAYESTVETTEETVETLAARAEMGESLNVTPIDLDNRSDFIRGSEIVGAEIYTIRADMSDDVWMTGDRYDSVSAEWVEIGSVSEMVVDARGELRGLVAEVGGFLGIGDTHVLIDMQNVRWTQPDDDGDFAFVTRMTKDELASKRPVEKSWWQ